MIETRRIWQVDPIAGAAAGVAVVFPAGASVMAPPEVQSTDPAAALQHPDDHAGSPVECHDRGQGCGDVPMACDSSCGSTDCSPKCLYVSDRETDTVTDRDRDYIKYTETEITQSGTQTDARTDRQRPDRDRECTGMHVSK